MSPNLQPAIAMPVVVGALLAGPSIGQTYLGGGAIGDVPEFPKEACGWQNASWSDPVTFIACAADEQDAIDAVMDQVYEEQSSPPSSGPGASDACDPSDCHPPLVPICVYYSFSYPNVGIPITLFDEETEMWCAGVNSTEILVEACTACGESFPPPF